MDVLNIASTGKYTKLTLTVNFKWNAGKKMNVIAKISWYLERSVVTLKLRKEYLNTVTRNTRFLLRIKYWTVWYIDRYSMSTYMRVTNFQKKTVRFFGPPCIYNIYNLSHYTRTYSNSVTILTCHRCCYIAAGCHASVVVAILTHTCSVAGLAIHLVFHIRLGNTTTSWIPIWVGIVHCTVWLYTQYAAQLHSLIIILCYANWQQNTWSNILLKVHIMWLVITKVRSASFRLVLHAQQIFANCYNFLITWVLQFSIARAYFVYTVWHCSAGMLSWPRSRGPKNWPRPRNYWPWPHDSCGLVVSEVLLKCFVMLTLKIWHFLYSV